MSDYDKDDNKVDDELGEPEEAQVSFVGPCSCEHDADEHGWSGCNIEDCLCDASWEE